MEIKRLGLQTSVNRCYKKESQYNILKWNNKQISFNIHKVVTYENAENDRRKNCRKW